MDNDSDSHPSRGRLVAYLDDELERDERVSLSRHLEECGTCAETVRELEQSFGNFSRAVAGMEAPRREVTAEELRRRAGTRDGGVRASDGRRRDGDGGDDGRGSRIVSSTPMRVAASLAVLLGAAAALPGSPVRSWIGESVRQVQDFLGGGAEEQAVVEAEPPRSEVEQRSGVAVPPSDGSVRITLLGVPGSTSVRLRLVDGPRAAVWNADGEYRTAPGRIEVTAPTSGELVVEIPRSAERARLEVNGRVAAVKNGGALDVRVPGTERVDGDFVFRPAGTK